MKVRRQLERLEPMILDPIRPVEGGDWHRAPAGKWSIAQILSHLAIGIDLVGVAFEKRFDKNDMRRRATPRQALLRHVMLGVGKFPTSVESPALACPPDRPEPEQVTAEFRIGVERLGRLVDQLPEGGQTEIFVAHPFLGDLNLPEWVRFHYIHCRHHSTQIEKLLGWIAQNSNWSH